MQLKPITAIIVLFLVVASLLISGCTTSTTNQTPSVTSNANSTSTTPTAIQHDAFLEKYLDVFKNRSYADSSIHIRAYELEWINSTSAHLLRTYQNTSTKVISSSDQTFIVFPTSKDATNYLNAMNKTNYSLGSTEIPKTGTYQDVTGHAPQIYKQYVYNEGDPNTVLGKFHSIEQADNIIRIVVIQRL